MKKNLLQLLLDKNLITEQCYKEVKAISINSNCSEEQIILCDIKVDLNGLISIVENDFSIPYKDLESNSGKNGAFKLISKDIASRYGLIPFYYENNELHVAFSNPFDIKVIDELRFITNKKIKVFFGLALNISKTIEDCYGKQIVDVAVEELNKEYMLEDKVKNEESQSELFAENAPIIRITNSLLKQAVN